MTKLALSLLGALALTIVLSVTAPKASYAFDDSGGIAVLSPLGDLHADLAKLFVDLAEVTPQRSLHRYADAVGCIDHCQTYIANVDRSAALGVRHGRKVPAQDRSDTS